MQPVWRPLGSGRRSILALAAVGVLLGIGAVTDAGSLGYGAYLVAFVIWMAWFVGAFVRWLSTADF